MEDWKEHKKTCKPFNKIDNYEFISMIGEGNYTTIHKVMNKKSKKYFAVKEAPK